MSEQRAESLADGVAVVGMSGRFPGANGVEEFWRNLREGVESVSFFADEGRGGDPRWVGAAGLLDDIESFDAPFFNFNQREAEVTDPQHRIFLECAWEALEDAGYDAAAYQGLVGVYAGAAVNTYLLGLNSYESFRDLIGSFHTTIGNEKDYLTTRISYKLNLRGPSLAVQTACSTSLVAICLACEALLAYQCDMALAGGVSVRVPQKSGYLYEEGGILSPDGHCRAFDARARGTVGGNGAGLVLLKRLDDARADGDQIHAVIKGSAVNNDGALKAGFTAPSADSQAEVIAAALAAARVGPQSISYVEAHGTGTTLGDPIEVRGLTRAFRAGTDGAGFCALGSVKTNIGHLDTAAGVAGLLKTVLALKHEQIPPSLHFTEPNPEIDFAATPFFVNTALRPWARRDGGPRRAGVSSFGIGGTNAHVIVEEAPVPAPSGPGREWALLPLSAKTETALSTHAGRMAAALEGCEGAGLSDAAYTLAVGRQAFAYRRAVVCRSGGEAAAALRDGDPRRVLSGTAGGPRRPVVFMFPGQGTQRVNMGRELYERERVFRRHVDRCADLLRPEFGCDLRELLYPRAGGEDVAARRLAETGSAQPALFAVEYALARLWMSWGVAPRAMIGHSLGEFVAACLAGVLSLKEALRLVTVRGRLMQGRPGGAMLGVALSEAEARRRLGGGLSLAAVNAPQSCVMSGAEEAVAELERRLSAEGIGCKRLHTSHAFHSEMMEPAAVQFELELRRARLHEPRLPYVSNVSGRWVEPAEARSAAYWSRHLRECVRFADGLQLLLAERGVALLEVGPGNSLTALARQQMGWRAAAAAGQSERPVAVASLGAAVKGASDGEALTRAAAEFWVEGGELNWGAYYSGQRRRRAALPTYPFERRRYWIEGVGRQRGGPGHDSARQLKKREDVADWFYLPSWQRVPPARPRAAGPPALWLVFVDGGGVGEGVARRLEEDGHEVFGVEPCEGFRKLGPRRYGIRADDGEEYERLLRAVSADARGLPVLRVMHLWCVDGAAGDGAGGDEDARARSFYSLLYLARALGAQQTDERIELSVISTEAQEVSGRERLSADKATLLGPCAVIAQEFTNILCRSIDVEEPGVGRELIERLAREVAGASDERVVAYRGRHRWAQRFEAVRLEAGAGQASWLKGGGCYLITGGLGGVGFVLARHLARAARARLVLTMRSALPARETWADWLKTHDAQDPLSLKLRRAEELEALGAELLLASCDAADEARTREVIEQARASFGRIDGVIHAAGVDRAAARRTIAETTREQAERIFSSKIRGALLLERLMRPHAPDFFILASSLSGVLGGLGYAAYAAANVFLNTLALSRDAAGGARWLSVEWDGWQFEEEQTPDALGATLAALAIRPEEGEEAFRRILRADAGGRLIVSTGDLQARIRQWLTAESLQGTDAAPGGEAEAHAEGFAAEPRPQLKADYVAPGSELETKLANIWQGLLGIGRIGVHDDFFELGGHSLLATQLASRLRQTFRVNLPLRELFATPTISALARVIVRRQAERADEANVAQILSTLENLSDAEAAALLARGGEPSAN
jgi:acyl transferase domain-containing protein